MTKSKLSIGVWFGGPFLLGLLVFGVWLIADSGVQLTDIENTGTWFGLGVLLTLAAVAGLLVIGNQLIVITVYKDRIVLWNLFFRKTLWKDELRSIDFMNRERVSGLGGGGEFITIETMDGKKFQSEISFYRNAVELKRALWKGYQPVVMAPGRTGREGVGVKVGREQLSGREDAGRGNVGYEDEGEKGRRESGQGFRGQGLSEGERFSSPLLLSFRFYLFLSFIWAFSQAIFSVISEHYAHALIFVTILFLGLIFFYYLFGSYLYYFKLSGDALIVRNPAFFWWERVYPIREIGGLVFETGARAVLGLRVRTVDFDSVLYWAGSLRERVWKRLLERCGELDIPVVDER